MKIKEAISEIKESGLYGNQVHQETLVLALNALEKQIPRTVREIPDKHYYGVCPVCGRIYWNKCHICNYCELCGQNLQGGGE